jgi:hypothetical protein
MKFKIVSVSVVLAAALAFAMAPAHADEGGSEGSTESVSSSSSGSDEQGLNPSSPDDHENTEGQGHIKYENDTLKGKGLGHGKKCASCS